MNLKGIKEQSDEIYHDNKKQMISQYFYIGYLSLLAQYLQKAFFSLFVSLFMCSVSHGYVKCAMKVVDEEKIQLGYRESMIGMLEFSRVAPVYIMKKIIVLLCCFIATIPIIIFSGQEKTLMSMDWLTSLGNAFIQTEFFIPYFHQYSSLIKTSLFVINCILIIVIYLYLTALFLLVPYVMEQEELSWIESFQYSIKHMKGHLFSFLKLYLYYIKRHVFYWGVTGLSMYLLGDVNECFKLFCFVFSLLLYIDVFKGRFEIAKYLFYKQIQGTDLH